MSNDVERIKGLEKESGIALPGRSFDEIDNFAANGYAADQNGNVTGLNLSNNNLEKTPASESLISTLPHLHHLKKLSLSNTTLTDYSFLKRFWGQVHGL